MSEQEKREVSHDGFHTDDVDDLAELLHRAENYASDGLGLDEMALEFREAREFVEDELEDQEVVAP